MKVSKCVWLCDLIRNDKNHLGMGSSEKSDPERKKIQAANAKAHERGQPLSADSFPEFMYVNTNPPKGKPWRDFTISWFWILSERYAAVFRDFDLGNGGLYPADIRKNDRVTPIDGGYYFLSCGATKNALIPEKSQHLGKWAVEPGAPDFSLRLAIDDGVVLSKAALDGPDFWVDESLKNAYFFSDRIVQAMKKAKIATKFALHRCPVE